MAGVQSRLYQRAAVDQRRTGPRRAKAWTHIIRHQGRTESRFNAHWVLNINRRKLSQRDHMKNRMYDDVKTWNPFKGCLFDCVYCRPSFQLQAKRQKHNCVDCYNYTPHEHLDRLNKIPSADTIFVCGNSDISFCELEYTHKIIESIKKHNQRRPDKTYYFQSKRPEYFKPFLSELPGNAIILTTLETNRDDGYRQISKAPAPSVRYKQLKALDYPRKVVTIEPVLDFDLEIFVDWINALKPEYVWLGYNSRPKQVTMSEPNKEKLTAFILELNALDIQVKEKDLRGIE